MLLKLTWVKIKPNGRRQQQLNRHCLDRKNKNNFQSCQNFQKKKTKRHTLTYDTSTQS